MAAERSDVVRRDGTEPPTLRFSAGLASGPVRTIRLSHSRPAQEGWSGPVIRVDPGLSGPVRTASAEHRQNPKVRPRQGARDAVPGRPASGSLDTAAARRRLAFMRLADGDEGVLGSVPGFSGGDQGKAATRRCAMRRILLIVTAVLLVVMLSFALAGCRKSSGNKGGGGYLPAPTRTSVLATAVA